MRIGIDFDDVISHTSQPLSQAISKHFGVDIDLNTTTTYQIEQIINKDSQQVERAFEKIGKYYSFHKQLSILKNCKSTLKRLKRAGHSLFVISARSTWLLPYSTVWLKYHGILSLITALIHRPEDKKKGNFKAVIAKELNLHLLIEDALLYALPVAKAGVPVILFDAPHNRQEKLPKNIYRIKGWHEVPKIIAKIAISLI